MRLVNLSKYALRMQEVGNFKVMFFFTQFQGGEPALSEAEQV